MRAVIAALLTLGLAACEPPTDAAFGAKVRAYLLENPEVLQEAYEKLQEKQQAEALKASATALKENRKLLENDARDHVVNPDGKVTVVEFLDYNCGYCKLVAPEVVELARDPNVRLVFKDMTIFGEASEYAAAASRQASGAKYLALHEAFMAQKPLDQAAVDRILTAQGLSPAAAKARLTSPEQQKYLEDQQKLAAALGIQGTPAFIVGDVLIPGADAEALKAAVAEAKKG
ncbi:MAG TPA: DsbA family protein [Caulobacteraceae bacterium]|nr:DsbA family protein [Caulobacteraceae bacterium]